MRNFPTKATGLGRGESPSLYDMAYQENVEKASVDGGYEFRRRKFTRAPRRIISTGYIDLPHEDFLLIEEFWLAHQMDVSFRYFDYMNGVSRVMRFDEFKPDANSIGTNRRWNIKIKMSEL